MRKNWGLGAVIGVILLFVSACGDVGGSGQCGGAAASGLCVNITSITPTDTVNSIDTSSVDIFRNPDCDSTTAGAQLEPWGAHSAKVTFDVSLPSGATTPPAASFVTIDQYTVEFTANSAGPAGPDIVSIGPLAETINVQTEGTTTVTLKLVPTETKVAYINNGGPQTSITSYTATYTFSGKDQFDRSISVRGFAQINLGNFDMCSGGAK